MKMYISNKYFFLGFLNGYPIKILLLSLLISSISAFVLINPLYSQLLSQRIKQSEKGFFANNLSAPSRPKEPSTFRKKDKEVAVDLEETDAKSNRLSNLTDSPPLRIHVMSDAPGPEDGLSWETAYNNIQEAIDKTPDDRLIEIWVAKGLYNENLVLRSGIQLFGSFDGTEEILDERILDPNLTIIDGNKNGPVILAEGVEDVVIDGFTITNGDCTNITKDYLLGGGIYCHDSSSLIIKNNKITGNSAYFGGGMECSKSISITISNNTISENMTIGDGGGIDCYESSAQINDNNITLNQADNFGGGIACSDSISLTISHNTISENSAALYGGGIYCYKSSAQIHDNLITLNQADDAGGGVLCFESPSITILNNMISENSAAGDGGGIYCHKSSAQIHDNLITLNQADDAGGGVLCFESPSITILNNMISENSAAGDGGGIACYKSSYAQIYENQISHNQAVNVGGGIACSDSTSVTISKNEIAENSTPGNGGGVSCSKSSLDILENIIRENHAYNGGGIICLESTSTSITNNTIIENTVDGDGGGIACYKSSAQISENLITKNHAENVGGGITFTEPTFLVILKNRISENTATGDGGGVACSKSSAQIVENDIINNYSGNVGGGIRCSDSASINISKNTISENSAVKDGGGIACYNSSARIVENQIFFNHSDYAGGGIACLESDSVTISRNMILKNTSAGSGGGISCSQSSVLIVDNIITNNHAEYAGGIACLDSESVLIKRNELSENTATEDSGGIYFEKSSGYIDDNLITKNNADSAGGGIFCFESIFLSITKNVISENTATDGGGIYSFHSSPHIIDNLITGNQAENGKNMAFFYQSFPIIQGNTIDPDTILYDEILPPPMDTLNPWGRPYGIKQIEGVSALGIDICISGEYAYLANRETTLQIIDIKDPNYPVIRGSLDIQRAVTDIEIDGGYAYLTDEETGLMIFDIADPNYPLLISEQSIAGKARGISVSGDRAYVVSDVEGLCPIDITSKEAPLLETCIPIPNIPYNLYVSDGFVYVVNGEGLLIADFTDKGAPWIISRIETPGKALDVCLSGDGSLAYIADGESGLQIVDLSDLISDPNKPKIVATLDTDGNASDIELSNGYIYIADGATGIQVIDVSDPLNPSVVHTISPFYSTQGITVKDEKIFAVDLSGLYWLPVPAPPEPPSEWTIMVYMNADNDLERYGIMNINEMEKTGPLPGSVNVIVLVDRIHYTDSEKDDTSNGDWDTARIYKITQDEAEPDDPNIRSRLIRDMGELDMADPQTLEDYCAWVMDTYPAQRYSLIIWGYGTGLGIPNSVGFFGEGRGKGINADETSNRILFNKDIAAALEALKKKQKRVDVLGFDACLMGTIEVAYELKDLAEFIIFSSEKEPDKGWPYHDILETLAEDPGMTGEDLSRIIVKAYGDYYWDRDQEGRLERFHTLSAIRMDNIRILANAIDELATTILERWEEGAINKKTIEGIRERSLQIIGSTRPHMYIDLHYFVVLIRNSGLPSDIKAKAGIVAQLLEETNIIIERRFGKGYINSSSGIYPDFAPDPYLGLSIYFPKYNYIYSSDIRYNSIAIDFPNYTSWGELLEKYFEDPARDESYPWDGTKCSLNTSGLAFKVKVYGEYAYVVDDTGGILVIDINNPKNPKLAKSISTPGVAMDVTVLDDYAYILWQDSDLPMKSGLDIFDITREYPLAVASASLEYRWPAAIYMNPYHSFAYVTNVQGVLQKIEIGVSDSGAFFINPGDAISIGSMMKSPPDIFVPEGTDYSCPFYMFMVNGHGLNRLEVLETGDGLSHHIAGTGHQNTPGISRDVYVKGDCAYVADSDEGLHIMDIVDPYPALKITGSVDTLGSAMGVCVSGDYAYVADGPEGLQVINISDPESPYIIRSYKLKDVAYDVHVRGRYAYVACGESGLWIISLQPEIEENDRPSWFWFSWCAPPPYTLYPYQFYWPNQVMNYARYLGFEKYQFPRTYEIMFPRTYEITPPQTYEVLPRTYEILPPWTYKEPLTFQYLRYEGVVSLQNVSLSYHHGYYMNNLSYYIKPSMSPLYYLHHAHTIPQFTWFFNFQEYLGCSLNNLWSYMEFYHFTF